LQPFNNFNKKKIEKLIEKKESTSFDENNLLKNLGREITSESYDNKNNEIINSRVYSPNLNKDEE